MNWHMHRHTHRWSRWEDWVAKGRGYIMVRRCFRCDERQELSW